MSKIPIGSLGLQGGLETLAIAIRLRWWWIESDPGWLLPPSDSEETRGARLFKGGLGTRREKIRKGNEWFKSLTKPKTHLRSSSTIYTCMVLFLQQRLPPQKSA